MASYIDLFKLGSEDSDLRNRIRVAGAIAAQAILTEAALDGKRVRWAASALVGGQTTEILNAVLAANKNASLAQIGGVSDAQIQTQVDAVIDGLVLAYNTAAPATI